MAAGQWAVSRSVRHQWGTLEIETVCVRERERERAQKARRLHEACADNGGGRRAVAGSGRADASGEERRVIAPPSPSPSESAARIDFRAERSREQSRGARIRIRGRRRAGSRRDAREERRVEAAASRSSRVESSRVCGESESSVQC